jgi:hypothetical protein
VNKQLELICKEAVVACFQLIFQHFSVGTAGNHEKVGEDDECSGRDSKRESPEYKTKAVPLVSTCSICCLRT